MEKNKFRNLPLIVMGVFLVFISSCEKENKNNTTEKVPPPIFNPSITYGTMTDQDGNTYKTVIIGTQTWMAENLRTTKYRDGEAIPEVTDDSVWWHLSTGAYCNYENTRNSDSIAIFGRLYNWYAKSKIAPTGWHIPSNSDWIILLNYLGGKDVAGGKLKEAGTTHWQSPNIGATNESGFTALPGGDRFFMGRFNGVKIGSGGVWWSSSLGYEGLPCHYAMSCSYGYVYSKCGDLIMRDDKKYGLSIRCIKD